MAGGGATARFDDLRADAGWVFGPPERVLVARSVDEVLDVLAGVDRQTRSGAWAWGYVGYDAAPAFDPALRARPGGPDDPPPAWFALGAPPTLGPAVRAAPDDPASRPPWTPDWTRARHRAAVERVRAAIAAGEVYQANLTTRLRARFGGDPARLYAALACAQRGAYNAYLDLGRHVIVSASPELFFEWDATGLTTRPMKGTAPRAHDNAGDELVRGRLVRSEKQRAENVMIVDLLRNDIARVVLPGSVRVTRLLEAERFETVWQLTSTVTGTPRTDLTLADLFGALFPSGSVTGAPKIAATRAISDVEMCARGVYCGAVGMVAPPGSAFRARFNVAIRTAVLDRVTGRAVYGSGGGITWGSTADEEYAELLAKATILRHPAEEFRLLETLRLEPGGGARHLDAHLRRMAGSAAYFGFATDLARLRAEVAVALEPLAALPGPRRVRLLLARDGRLRVEHAPLPADDGAPVTLAIDTHPTAVGRWTRHKTTRRGHYEAAAARHTDADDVILVDAHGRVIETTIANLAARVAGRWCTPPLSSGCLPGVERERLIRAGRLHERPLSVAEVRAGGELAVLSSLRGWRRARLRP